MEIIKFKLLAQVGLFSLPSHARSSLSKPLDLGKAD